MKKTFLWLAMAAMPILSFAEGPLPPGSGSNTGNGSVVIIRKDTRNPDPGVGRPRMPGRVVTLKVYYGLGWLTVEFPEDAESGMVTIGTGDFPVFTATVDRGNPTVELPQLSGDFLLTVSFDNDDVYEGEISM